MAVKIKSGESASAVIERIACEARRKAKPDSVMHATMKVDDYHRQGDVYIRRIEPQSGLKELTVRVQIAPGTSQGSRHCIDGTSLRHIRMYEKQNPTPLDGPILECFKPVEITHPEHGHVTVPAGWYEITYQRQLADELKRVAD